MNLIAGLSLALLAALAGLGGMTKLYLGAVEDKAAVQAELDGARAVATELHSRSAVAQQMLVTESIKSARYVHEANKRIARLQMLTHTGCEGADMAMDIFWEARREN